MGLSRRSFLLRGAATAGAAAYVGVTGASRSSGTSKTGRWFGYRPFTQDLFVPDVLTSLPVGTLRPTPAEIFARGPRVPRGVSADVAHGIAPEFGLCPDWNRSGIGTTHAREYLLYTEETTQRFVPGGPDVPIFAYRDGNTQPGSGRTPGPTILVDHLGPVVVRNTSLLSRDRSPVNTTGHDHETSIHLHGGHAPSHADGYPSFYVLPNEARDYYYPNIGPRVTDPGTNFASVCDGPFDEAWIPSTLWYHDHGMDVTGFNVSRGLAGFYLVVDERERALEASGVIPTIGGPQDIGLALIDQQFNGDGTLRYDFLDHNGRLGDVFTVNGVVQPRLKVQRRKYRFRFLNASNARVYEIRLSTRQKMCIIGTDGWLLPRGIEVSSFELSPAQRHDVIIDFRDAPDDVYVENIMYQTDGRGGIGVDPSRERDLLLKFEVEGTRGPSEVPCVEGTVLRGLAGIDPGGQWSPTPARQVVKTRAFRFDRANGAFTINNRFFNPRRADAVPALGVGAERWLFENSSGGWWHPIHVHLEGFQIQRVEGRLPRRERRFNSDTVLLHDGETAEVLVKFRTFTGPFVFHCHNIEHEDMRMMGVNDPTPIAGDTQAIDATPPLDGETRINPAQSGVVPTCEELEEEARLYFDEAGDVERLEGRGVGYPNCEFDNDLRGNQG